MLNCFISKSMEYWPVFRILDTKYTKGCCFEDVYLDRIDES